MQEMEDLEWDYFWENESVKDAKSSSIDQSSVGVSRLSEISEFFPEYVSKFQDERAKRAAAEEEEKRERLRKLLGLDKLKARDSVETIITSENTLSTRSSSSSDSSGNLCLKDITVSDSQLKLLNIYNIYPVPDDPGLVSGFWVLFSKEISYKEDGIQKFMDISKKMKLRPINKVCEMLKTDEINLGFYGVDPRIIRGVCEALINNTSVRSLNLQENWLSVDACFHLNDLLINNEILLSVTLTGCRIGPRGAKRLINGIGKAPALEYLNVSKCELGDEGATYICDGVSNSLHLKKLDLSDNDLGGGCAWSFYYMLAQTDTLNEINLSWNSLNTEEFWKIFLQGILKNNSVTKIDLSWNSLGKDSIPFLMQLMEKSLGITELNLSNNRFDDEDIKKLSVSVAKNSVLQILSLKSNPMGPAGALSLVKSLTPVNAPNSILQHLNLDNIWANKDIIPFLEEMKTRARALTIKLSGILSNYQLAGPDPRRLFLKRANFEAMKPKKKKQKKNFGHFIMSLDNSKIPKQDFQQLFKRYKLKLTDSLISEIMKAFEEGNGEVDQRKVKEFYLREYPETTPPPPKPEKKKKEKKGKKGNPDEANADGLIAKDKEAGVGIKKSKKKVQMMESTRN